MCPLATLCISLSTLSTPATEMARRAATGERPSRGNDLAALGVHLAAYRSLQVYAFCLSAFSSSRWRSSHDNAHQAPLAHHGLSIVPRERWGAKLDLAPPNPRLPRFPPGEVLANASWPNRRPQPTTNPTRHIPENCLPRPIVWAPYFLVR
ncbi:uncharacterized protein BCR38DRAFT_28688 [Pseudomassariella vexata]|uniref:Uncharacterized protein n=1 Tax=Pseudomassariella vexata TaxID=1141098 RepID=A0A1Y2EKV2_9PEZI|nr:uncharacterized protein BCR38DRAFT_28688 [Pseudomassariella vexata]ORY72172.1 hypothetical protein BCR38DRAFT_28688 [Pseudomassariella vexata]